MMDRDDSTVFVSPFLNFDPSLLVTDPNDQFIFPEGEKHRGRFERSFSEIGAMVIGGATVGGLRGVYAGRTNPELGNMSSKISRTLMLNHVTKSSASLAQTAGSIGLIYALADFLIHKARGGADDEINTVTAATVTGCLYKSPGLFQVGGWQRCLMGGAVGMAIGATAVAITSFSRIKQMLGS